MRKLWVSTPYGPALPFDVFNFDGARARSTGAADAFREGVRDGPDALRYPP
jgi:hypothetical protein